MSKRLAFAAAVAVVRSDRRRLRLERRVEQRHDADDRMGRRSLLVDHDLEVVDHGDHRLAEGGQPLAGLAHRPRSTTRRRRPGRSRRSLKSLGRPDTEAGQQAQDSVNELTNQIDDDMTKIQDTVSDASGVAGVLAAVPTITTTIQSAGSQVADTIASFEDLDAKGELEAAFKDADSCTTLAALTKARIR